MPWTKPRKFPLREPEQTHRGRQAPAMLRVRWVLELFLKMHESACCLDQAFKEIRVTRIRFQPELLEDIVGLIVAPLVPATEKGAVKRVVCDVRLTEIDSVTTQFSHQPRNPLAFVHGKPNFMAAQRMSKPLTIRSSEDTLTRPLSLARERRPLRRATPCSRK